LLYALHLAPQGIDLVRLFPRTGTNNIAVTIRLFHRGVNETLGISPDYRGELDTEQLERAISQLETIADRTNTLIQNARGGQQ
jgi:hypothetical protein